jgi:chromosome segregation ATPase
MSQNSQELGDLDIQCMELHLKIVEFSNTLDQLTKIQNEFVDLSEVYHKLKQDAQEIDVKLQGIDQQILESQSFILGSMDSKQRKYDNQIRELRRDLQNFQRITALVLVLFGLGLAFTWMLLSS